MFFVFSLSMLDLNGLSSSTTCLLTRLPHVGLYEYSGKQTEFHINWLNCVQINWAYVAVFCEMPEVGASVQTLITT